MSLDFLERTKKILIKRKKSPKKISIEDVNWDGEQCERVFDALLDLSGEDKNCPYSIDPNNEQLIIIPKVN